MNTLSVLALNCAISLLPIIVSLIGFLFLN